MKNMKNFLLFALLGQQSISFGQQPILSKWIINTTGKTASYWENTATPGPGNPPVFVFNTTTDSADVQRVCYTSDSVYVKATGMTDNMGKYNNPGSSLAQTYVYCFPRNPVVPATKTAAPANFAVGALLNGIPIFGRASGTSWNGTNNGFGGPQIWNTEVYLAEGVALDTAFGGHPQQQGQYHTHAKPYRLYEGYPTNQHSPIIGFSFDGYPVYGPYGYSAPTNSASTVARIKSGYSLRNITVRHTLPNGTVLSASQYGPNVSATYPIGTYCEDYEWLASNNGDLDAYNGRFCVTPEYPAGTYAYFTTLTSALVPQYPYYIGPYYYGTPNTKNFNGGCLTRTMPTSGLTCVSNSVTGIFEMNKQQAFAVFPNPNDGSFTIDVNTAFSTQKYSIRIYNLLGALVFSDNLNNETYQVNLKAQANAGVYFVYLMDEKGTMTGVQKIVVE